MSRFNCNTALLTGCLLLLLCFSPVRAHEEQNSLTFGIHPYLNATNLIERFTPLIDYLAEKMDIHIHTRVGSSYQNHIDAIALEEIDFAYMGPASYLNLIAQKKNIVALGRLSYSDRNSFRGAIIVRQDSSITSLDQLRNKHFAFGDPNSTLSSIVPQRLLENAGVKTDELGGFAHLKNHRNVALAVLMGKYDAGGVKEEVFNEYKSRGLKVLQWSPYIPTHIFVANSTMGKEKIKQLQQLLLTINQQPDGINILSKIKKGISAIIPAHSDDYAELRTLISSRKASAPGMESGR